MDMLQDFEHGVDDTVILGEERRSTDLPGRFRNQPDPVRLGLQRSAPPNRGVGGVVSTDAQKKIVRETTAGYSFRVVFLLYFGTAVCRRLASGSQKKKQRRHTVVTGARENRDVLSVYWMVSLPDRNMPTTCA